MPELPEVETVRRALVPVMEGRRILSAHVGRPDFAALGHDYGSLRLRTICLQAAAPLLRRVGTATLACN